MRRVITLFIISCLAISGIAQTQLGMVKTKGRMVNGKHVAGQGLSGVTIIIQGRSAVLTQANGSFSFPVTANTFMVQKVQKSGYQLVDADATLKSYKYSANTFYVLMETPEQQAEDKLAAERKIRRTLQRQLQQREDELEELKAENKVTQEEYQKKLQQLYDDQQNNEKLIADMAKRYSELDYDQMDELNQQISDAILNGELTKADSLLQSKGDIRQRIEDLQKHEQANEQVRQDLEKSEALARQRRDDLARDCYSHYELFKMKNEHDSAAYFIRLRANLDTLNLLYQTEAAEYHDFLNYKKTANYYWGKVLRLYLRNIEAEKDKKISYDPYHTIRGLAGVARALSYSGDIETGIKLYEVVVESLEATNQTIKEQNRHAEGLDLSIAYHKRILASLYMNAERYEDCEQTYKNVLDIYRHYLQRYPDLEPSIATALSGLADLYYTVKRTDECISVLSETQAIYRRLLATEPTNNLQSSLSNTLYTQGKLFKALKRYDESEQAFEECVSIRKGLYDVVPQTYSPGYSRALTQLASVYFYQKRYEEAYQKQDSAHSIRSLMYRWQPALYKDVLIETKGVLSYYGILTRRFQDAEDMAEDALAGDSTQHWINVNMAAALLLQGKYKEAEPLYRQLSDSHKEEALEDLQLYAEAGVIPEERKEDVERIKRLLSEP